MPLTIQKILCPIDFSKFNDFANELATELAVASGAAIVYLNIAWEGDNYEYAKRRVVERELPRLKKYCPTNQRVPFSHEIKMSALVGQSIVDFANENNIDLIVLSTHGRTGLSRLIMGSVTEFVVRNSRCPVMTVKPLKSQLNESPDSNSIGASA